MTGEFLKLCAIVLLSLGLCVLLKSYRPEYAFLLTVGVGVIAATVIVARVFPELKRIEQLYVRSSGNSDNFTLLLKALAISYIAGFCADTCRDFGQSSLAQKVEFAGRCAIFILSVPLLISILQTTLKFIDL